MYLQRDHKVQPTNTNKVAQPQIDFTTLTVPTAISNTRIFTPKITKVTKIKLRKAKKKSIRIFGRRIEKVQASTRVNRLKKAIAENIKRRKKSQNSPLHKLVS